MSEALEAAPAAELARLGVVLIGRNEGERLRLALDSIPEGVGGVVYVDSGSTDDSVGLALSRGVAVVDLDLTTPFTAARARNAGFEHLLREHPDLAWVQFMDGDCSLVDGWLEEAVALMAAHPEWVAVCGWRRERHPERTLYNRFCDLEWIQTPVGDVDHVGFGGDVVIRVEAFRRVGGFDPGIIAAEDSELSMRLQEAGGRVVRVDRPMTRHDADIRHFSQWWSRSVRCGHAYAEIASRRREKGTFRRNVRSTLLWGLVLPLAALVTAFTSPPGFLVVLAIFALQVARIGRRMDPGRFPPAHRLLWGVSCVISQMPKLQGMLRFARDRGRGGPRIIEYK